VQHKFDRKIVRKSFLNIRHVLNWYDFRDFNACQRNATDISYHYIKMLSYYQDIEVNGSFTRPIGLPGVLQNTTTLSIIIPSKITHNNPQHNDTQRNNALTFCLVSSFIVKLSVLIPNFVMLSVVGPANNAQDKVKKCHH
jgi:hypothetical protein